MTGKPFRAIDLLRQVHNWMECTQDECSFGNVLWQPVPGQASSQLIMTNSGGHWLRWLRTTCCCCVPVIMLLERVNIHLLVLVGDTKRQLLSDIERPENTMYIWRESVLWSLLHMVCSYSVSCLRWYCESNSFIPERVVHAQCMVSSVNPFDVTINKWLLTFSNKTHELWKISGVHFTRQQFKMLMLQIFLLFDFFFFLNMQ